MPAIVTIRIETTGAHDFKDALPSGRATPDSLKRLVEDMIAAYSPATYVYVADDAGRALRVTAVKVAEVFSTD